MSGALNEVFHPQKRFESASPRPDGTLTGGAEDPPHVQSLKHLLVQTVLRNASNVRDVRSVWPN